MKYLKYFEGHSDDLIHDIKDILLEFSDNGIKVNVFPINYQGIQHHEIQVYIGTDGYQSTTSYFHLDDDKKNALIRLVDLTKDKYMCSASLGSPKKFFIIQSDEFNQSNFPREYSKVGISYISIFLYPIK